MESFVFNDENLIDNLHRMGGWSQYGLAEKAIMHYHKEEVESVEEGYDQTEKVMEIALRFPELYWSDWIKRYHEEIGYNSGKNGFDPSFVNFY